MKAAKITHQITPLLPPLTQLMLAYATNSSSFWNSNPILGQERLLAVTPEEEEKTSLINKVPLR